MKAIVAGADAVGTKISRYLINAGYNVMFIDKNIDAIREVTSNEGFAGVYGECTSLENMKEIGIEATDVFIAVTKEDEVNILGCEVAKFYGVETRIAKITKPTYLTLAWRSDMYNNIIDVTSVVSPDVTLIDFLIKRLEYNYTNIGKVLDFFEDKVKILSVYCNDFMCSLSSNISDFYQLFSNLNLKIVAIAREGKFLKLSDETFLKPGDIIYTIIEESYVKEFLQVITAYEQDSVNKYYDNNHITIIGNHPSILYLAEKLIDDPKSRVNIVINDQVAAESIAKALQRTAKDRLNILYASSLEDSIQNLYLRRQEKIIIFSKDDRENFFLSLYCKYNNIDNLFCILQNSKYEHFMNDNGINNLYIIDQYILLPIMNELKGAFENNLQLIRDDLEVLELTLHAKSTFIGKRLRDLQLPSGIQALAVYSSDGEKEYIYIKDDNLLLQEDDKVIFTIKYSHIKEAHEIFNQYIDK